MFKVALIFSLFVFSPALAEPSSPFGEPVDGLQLGLTVNRTTFAPGEVLYVRGFYQNVSEHLLAVPGFASIWPRGILHIRTPDGRVYISERGGRSMTWAGSLQIDPGHLAALNHPLRFRFCRPPHPWWEPADKENTQPIDMSRPGRYKLWAEHEAEAVGELGASGWSGRVSSPVITVTVRPMPVDKRKMQPTDAQLADIDELGVVPNRKKMDIYHARVTRLRLAAARTENEGLAIELAKQLIQDWDAGEYAVVPNLFVILSDRSGHKHAEPGIDGPYLKMLAGAVVERLDNRQLVEKVPENVRNRGSWFGPMKSLHFATIYAYHHPRDKAFIEQLGAKLQSALKDARDPKPIWQAMLDAKVLHDGMTVEQAIELLGEPTSRGEKSIDWYHSTPRHVNPGIRGKIEDGKIVEWKMYTG
jgi:hypothetical protein